MDAIGRARRSGRAEGHGAALGDMVLTNFGVGHHMHGSMCAALETAFPLENLIFLKKLSKFVYPPMPIRFPRRVVPSAVSLTGFHWDEIHARAGGRKFFIVV